MLGHRVAASFATGQPKERHRVAGHPKGFAPVVLRFPRCPQEWFVNTNEALGGNGPADIRHDRDVF